MVNSPSEKQEHPCPHPAGNPSLLLQDAQTCLLGIQLIAHRAELKHQGRRGSAGNQCLCSPPGFARRPKKHQSHTRPDRDPKDKVLLSHLKDEVLE